VVGTSLQEVADQILEVELGAQSRG
jgi:hypothetical protein